MATSFRPRSRPVRPGGSALLTCAALLAAAFLLAGCGGGQFGSEIAARPKPLPITATGSITIRLPQDHKFSLVLPRETEQPGLDGTAEANANAQAQGTADAAASVARTGQAEAVFQLGHVFANETDRQLDLDFRVTCRYAFEVRNEPERLLPDARVALRLYARPQRGPLVRDVALLEHSTEAGPGQGQAEATRQFTVTLAPGDSLTVWLAGQARAEIAAERSGTATLRVSDLQFEVVTRPAPPVRMAPESVPAAPPGAQRPGGP